MPGDLRELITASFDATAADAWSKFTVGEADKLVLHEAALKVLSVFPRRMPGQCALMSALYSLALEKLGSQRGYVVVGSLYIGDKRVFGEDKKFDGKKLFSEFRTSIGTGMQGSSMAIGSRMCRSAERLMPAARGYSRNTSPKNSVRAKACWRAAWLQWTRQKFATSRNMC